MSYVDGYVLSVPKKHLAAYKRLAGRQARALRDEGNAKVMADKRQAHELWRVQDAGLGVNG